MNFTLLVHIINYCTFFVIVLSGFFGGNELLIVVKPLSGISLLLLYLLYRNQVHLLFPFTMLLIMVNDAFILQDFEANFRIVGVLLPLFYFFNIYLLLPYVNFKNLKFKSLISLPVIITSVLIIYLTVSILSMVFLKLEKSIFFIVFILVSLFTYLILCFIVYLQNNFTYTFYVLITAMGSIFVNAMVPIHELYLKHPFFAASLNAIDFASMYFFLQFLIKAELKNKGSVGVEYF